MVLASPEEKKELITELKAWQCSAMTQRLLEWLTESLIRDEGDEDKASFSTEFETIQDYSWHKGSRQAYRSVAKQLKKD